MRCWMEMPYEDCGQPAGAPSCSTFAKMAPSNVCLLFFNTLHACVPDTQAPRLPATPREDTALLALSLSFSSVLFGKGYRPKFQAVSVVQTRLWRLHFQNRLLFALLSLGWKFSVCMQNCTAVRGLLAGSEPMGLLAKEDGRNAEWKGCGKLIIYLISRARSVFIRRDYRASTFTLEKSDWQSKTWAVIVDLRKR